MKNNSNKNKNIPTNAANHQQQQQQILLQEQYKQRQNIQMLQMMRQHQDRLNQAQTTRIHPAPILSEQQPQPQPQNNMLTPQQRIQILLQQQQQQQQQQQSRSLLSNPSQHHKQPQHQQSLQLSQYTNNHVGSHKNALQFSTKISNPDLSEWDAILSSSSTSSQSKLPIAPAPHSQHDVSIHTFLSRSSFDAIYHDFYTKRSMNLPHPPSFASKPLDLYHLFTIVANFGGVDNVHEMKVWSFILRMLKIDPSANSAGFTINQLYRAYLYDFEHFYAANQRSFFKDGKSLRLLPTKEDVNALIMHILPVSQSPFHSGQTITSRPSTHLQHSPQKPRTSVSSSPPSSTIVENPASPKNYENLANLSSQSALFPPVENSKTRTKLIVRPLDTYGGFDIDRLNSLYRGDGPAHSKHVFFMKDDLGLFDWEVIRKGLISPHKIDELNALQTLLIISHDGTISFELTNQIFILYRLLDMWEESLNLLMKARKTVTEAKDCFWSYSQLFDFEQRMLEHLEYGPLSQCSSFYCPNSNPGEIPMVDIKDAAEKGLLISTCFRNFSQIIENALLLSKTSRFMSIMFKWTSFAPETSISSILRNEITKPDCHLTFLPQRKNILLILHALSTFYTPNDENEIHIIFKIVLDFMSDSFFESSQFNHETHQNIRVSSQMESTLPTIEDHYSQCALECLFNMLANPDFRAFASNYPAFLIETVKCVSSNLPIGFPQRISQISSGQLFQPFYDLTTVQLSVRCLHRLTQVESHEMLTLCSNSLTLIRILVRLCTGFAWINTPFYSSDNEFRNSALGTGITAINDRTTSAERELIQEVYMVVSKNAGKALRNILKFKLEAGSELLENYKNKYHAIWGHQQRTERVIDVDLDIFLKDNVVLFADNLDQTLRSSLSTLSDVPVVDDLEMSLIGMTLNKRLPQDMAELMAELLYLMAKLTA